MHAPKLRVLVVDDHEAMRYTICRVLMQFCDVVGEAANGPDALQEAARLQPDLVVLDVSMPAMSGFDVARILIAERPDVLIIFASQHAEALYANEAQKLGTHGYVLKPEIATEYPAAIAEALAGRFYRSPRVAA